jgi:hypothetical protein
MWIVGKFPVLVMVAFMDIWNNGVADILVVASAGGVLLESEERGFGRVVRGRGTRG